MSKFSLKATPVRFHPVMEAVAEAVFSIFDEQIEAFYTVGSAARGDFIDSVSDLDFRCVLSDESTDEQVDRWLRQKTILTTKFDYDIELVLYTKARLDAMPTAQFGIAGDGHLIFGRPYAPTATFPAGGLELAQFLSQNMPRQIAEARAAVNSPSINPGDYARISRWIAKVGIRLAANIAVARGVDYTPSIAAQKQRVEANLPDLAAETGVLYGIYIQPADTKLQLMQAMAAVVLVSTMAEAAKVIKLQGKS